MNTVFRGATMALTLLILGATAATAQTIAGIVRDTSGAVMPGVTVEVASPALIERVRTGMTDGTGQYSIVSLSPGVYTVTFTLPGFNTIKREGIELTTGFTATVNAELRVGALEETITVSGASPLVDIQAVTKATVITRDVIDALPTAHSIQAAGVLIPGLTSSGGATGGGRDVGGNTMLQQPTLTFHGNTQTIQLWDGFWLSNVQGTGTGGATSFYVNDGGTQELSYQTGADSITVATPSVAINMIPKDGGNETHGAIFSDFTYEPWSWGNLTDELTARGMTKSGIAKVKHISDFNPSIGGPIEKNKFWYYIAFRYQALNLTQVDNFYDKNPAPYIYEPDLDRPAIDDGRIPNESVRLTYQVSAKDKIAYWFTNQNKRRNNFSLVTGYTPDALAIQTTPHAQAQTIKWSRTQTTRLLFEAGGADGSTLYIEHYKPHVTPNTYAITDQANNKSFNAYPPGYSEHGGSMQDASASATYVTGSHAIKGGMMFSHGVSPNPTYWTGDITMTFNNGSPQSVTLRIPRDTTNGWLPDLGFFAQDRWTFKRATMTGGIRYDYFVSNTLDGTLPASRWNPAQFFPGEKVLTWKDISPRAGIAYDLRGDGRTAVKANISRYIAAENVSTATNRNPQLTIGNTDIRTWRDNGDYTIYNADGSVQWEELGPTTNNNFGKVIPTTTTQDPRTLNGYNARPSTIEWQTLIQHQLTPRIALNGGYYFRYIGNQTATDNTLITSADFDGPFCITAPKSPQLPDGGGYPVCGLYDLKTAAQGKVQDNVTFARNFGGVTDHYMGYDIGMTARLRAGTFVTGGINAQRRVYDSCNTPIPSGTTGLRADSPEARFCHQVTPYRPDLKFNGSHTLPGEFVISGTYQLTSGPNIVATWAAPNSIIAPALNRNLAAGATATKSIQLIEPGKYYEKFLNQLDLRLSKRYSIGRFRMRGDINLYNVFNSDFISAINTTFSTTASNQFQRPTAVVQGRLFKIGGQFDF